VCETADTVAEVWGLGYRQGMKNRQGLVGLFGLLCRLQQCSSAARVVCVLGCGMLQFGSIGKGRCGSGVS
jgi:hypothetical protein